MNKHKRNLEVRTRSRDRLMAASFAFIVGTMSILNLFLHTNRPLSHEEFRSLQQAPTFSLQRYFEGSFARDMDHFLADQFFARSLSLEIGKRFNRLRGIGEMYVRPDGLPIYYIAEGNYCFRSYYHNPEMIAEYGETVQRLADAHPNLKVMNLVVPTSAAYVPEKFRKMAGDPRYANRQLSEFYKQKGTVPFINVSDALGSLDVWRSFFRSDHHWNGEGVYAAYEELCRSTGLQAVPADSVEPYRIDGFLGSHFRLTQVGALAKEPDTIVAYPPAVPVVLSRFTISADQVEMLKTAQPAQAYPPEDLVRTLDPVGYAVEPRLMGANPSYGIYLGGDYGLSIIRSERERKPGENASKILVFKDSMGNALAPLLANHYDEVHIIDPRHWYASLSRYTQEQGIDHVLIINSDSAALYGNYTEFIRWFWEE